MGVIIGSIELETGITVENAYGRIESVSGGKLGAEIGFRLYISQEAAVEGKAHVRQTPYTFIPSVEESAANFIKQGYEYLKSLEEFSGAIDA